MSSTLERRAVAVGDLLVGDGPAVVIGGRVSLRAHGGRADAYELLRDRATLAEPYSAADLPAVAELADAVVVGASWTGDIPLVRAAAGLGLPVVVERRAGAPMEEWLALAGYCAAEGDGRVILCDGARGGRRRRPDHRRRGTGGGPGGKPADGAARGGGCRDRSGPAPGGGARRPVTPAGWAVRLPGGRCPHGTATPRGRARPDPVRGWRAGSCSSAARGRRRSAW
ncbi:hypothetical protein [Nonomuraea sp. NPDC049480]|uniref:hypothetical protein n=1 Tax=Nonomuraea sp. NPDC049480 TaxID=3364353 RepID=UPI0037A1AA70